MRVSQTDPQSSDDSIQVIDPITTRLHEARCLERAPIPTVAERLGDVLGLALAPLAAGLSLLRDARGFHPRGAVYHGEITSIAHGSLVPLGERLIGPALLRFSGGLWKSQQLPDMLGLAIRLRTRHDDSPNPDENDQDLLFATAPSMLLLPAALLTTDITDYLANDYYAIAPFDIAGLGLSELRIVAPRPISSGTTRERKLAAAIREDGAVLRIELRRARSRDWEPLALLTITPPARLAIDERALRFSPFRDGRGLVPRGFVHALRRGVYAGSQWIARLRHAASHRLPAKPAN